MTNETRQELQARCIHRIAKLHDVYTDQHDANGQMVDHDSFVSDVLADLRHYCDAYGVDFDDRNRLGLDHYEAEVSEVAA